MTARYSPPLKPIRLSHAPASQSILRRRSRWLYALAALLLLYQWRSSIHLLPHRAPIHEPSLRYKNVDWSRYAYSQYATSSPYLCNAVMVFEALARLGSKADRILLYPQEWDLDVESSSDRDSQLLVIARDRYDVKLQPVVIPKADDDAWNGSYTKFMAWEQTQYDRVLHLDSDVTVLKHLDELFMLPRAPVAMLRAYWRLPSVRQLTSLFILLEPDEVQAQQLMVAASPNVRQKNEYDMEILNKFYGDSAMVLPHRQYGLLSGEFRIDDHRNYLGNSQERWDPERVLKEASLVHFSDWPIPKPWIMWPHNMIQDEMPKCKLGIRAGNDDCRDKRVWLGLYDDFRRRRKDICALLSAPAPDWHPPPKNTTEHSD
ncbi:N-acetylglucosaminyltransferase [Imshaugia aleurites]|uniref:N-acetylglucosaminyltransferase n=1 Tax=Imshaugia aleurites TaxID=172621 RepID=A0A8H3FVI1_9LECA|nr:N-acetylglucosaminyltransferase [Imshaugia aleurites]